MYIINFKTIKQYNGTLELDNTSDFMHNVSEMMLDKSIVSFEAFYPNGTLMKGFTNEHAVNLIKSCPVEKGHIGTKRN